MQASEGAAGAGWRRVDVIHVDGPVAVLGDIHGRADLLRELLAALGPMPVFVVGDVCDRGPDTADVIELLVQRGARGVRGNHDQWLCDLVDGHGFETAALNAFFGGEATLASYGITGRAPHEVERQVGKIPRAHREWLRALPAVVRLVVDGDPFWLVHAGVAASWCVSLDPNRMMSELAENDALDLLWRSQEPHEMDELDGPIVFGHVPRREPVDAGHAIGIDTGSGGCADGRLTAVVLPQRRFVTIG